MPPSQRPRQKGFTLVELIAVLVLLGILAAIAIPGYIDMMEQARRKQVQGAFEAALSQVHLEFAQRLQRGQALEALSDQSIGDFSFSSTSLDPGTGVLTVTIVDGPPGWDEGLSADDKRKSIRLQ